MTKFTSIFEDYSKEINESNAKIPKKIGESLSLMSKGVKIYQDNDIIIMLELSECKPYIAVYRMSIDWRDSKNSKMSFVDGDHPWGCSEKEILSTANKMIKKYANKGPSYSSR